MFADLQPINMSRCVLRGVQHKCIQQSVKQPLHQSLVAGGLT